MPNSFGSKRRSKKEIDKMDVPGLLRSLDYGRYDHPTVIKCFQVMSELNKWIDSVVSEDERPIVHLVLCKYYVSILIGDSCIWNSEYDKEDNLTFDYCKEAFHDEVLKLAAVFEL